jgi:hypothetical protein
MQRLFNLGSVSKTSVGSLFTEDEIQDVVEWQADSFRIMIIIFIFSSLVTSANRFCFNHLFLYRFDGACGNSSRNRRLKNHFGYL